MRRSKANTKIILDLDKDFNEKKNMDDLKIDLNYLQDIEEMFEQLDISINNSTQDINLDVLQTIQNIWTKPI